MRSHGLTNEKVKQIVDCVEGTGSNELPTNKNGGDTKRDNGNNDNPPSFAPNHFFDNLQKGPFAKRDNSADQKTNDTVQGKTRVTGYDLKTDDGNKPLRVELQEKAANYD